MFPLLDSSSGENIAALVRYFGSFEPVGLQVCSNVDGNCGCLGLVAVVVV